MKKFDFHVGDLIGKGSFGETFKGKDNSGNEYALKYESSDSENLQLLYECRIYRYFSGAFGFPSVKWFGKVENSNVLVMDLYGESLDAMFERHNKTLSLKTVLMLADQMISRIEYVHKKGFVHRDIKPQNFLFGRNNKRNSLFLIDFGLAQNYIDLRTKEHVEYSEEETLVGTARYCSINSHMGIRSTRRDDMESLGYVLVYLLKGRLPWSGINAETAEEKYAKIAECKIKTSIQSLTEYLPEEFNLYMTLVRSIRFSDEPDYEFFRQMFRSLFLKQGYVYDYVYE